MDIFDNKAAEHKCAVEKVLEDIGAGTEKKILVLNKSDLLSDEQKRQRSVEWPEGILVSARGRSGLPQLVEAVEKTVHLIKKDKQEPVLKITQDGDAE